MEMSRFWVSPTIWTFKIPVVKKLLEKYNVGEGWVDPFAGENSPAELTNDIEDRGAKFQMDALEFLKTLPSNSAKGVLLDPPYSVEQCLRRYTPRFKGTAGRSEYRTQCKNEAARVIQPEGFCIMFAWDSTGMGKCRRFVLREVMLLCHGACHNDTIVTVEQKNVDWFCGSAICVAKIAKIRGVK